MWRRIPVLPMLIGIFGAWALLGMWVAGDEKLSNLRIFVVAGALGALFALIVRPLLRTVGSPQAFGWLGFGCLHGCLGVGFVAAIAVLPAMMMGREVAFRDWPGMV